MEDSLNGKVAVVTGATSGLGRSVATVFAKRGAHVVITGRREQDSRTAWTGADEVLRAGATPIAARPHDFGNSVDRWRHVSLRVLFSVLEVRLSQSAGRILKHVSLYVAGVFTAGYLSVTMN